MKRKPVAVAKEIAPLVCASCKKDIEDLELGLYALVIEKETKQIVGVYFAHKGTCDHALEKEAVKSGRTTKWTQLSDATIPQRFMEILITTINQLRSQKGRWSAQGWDKWKKALLVMSQYAFRETSSEERKRLEVLVSIPL